MISKLVTSFIFSILFGSFSFAGIAKQQCYACHGKTGVSANEATFPSINMHSKDDLFKMLTSIRDSSGKKKANGEKLKPLAMQMVSILKGKSDQDVKDLIASYMKDFKK